MTEESAIPYLREVLVFLGAAVLVVPIFHRLKVSPVLGYLAVGLLIGPYGLRFITDVDGVRHLAELGVVFLLFKSVSNCRSGGCGTCGGWYSACCRAVD